MVMIKVHLQKGALHPHDNLLHRALYGLADDDAGINIEAESTRLFDVCNAFVDALRNMQPYNTSATDAVVFSLIESGAIPQVPTIERDEIVEFIQKITFALSSIPRLVILCELHSRPMIRATVGILEMATGISEQTLRRHLFMLTKCRLVERTRIGQTYLYESIPMRLATLTYLWNELNKVET